MVSVFSGEGNRSKQDLKDLSVSLQKTRTTILDNLRNGLLPLSPDVTVNVNDAAKDETNPLYLYLQQMFYTELQGIT